MEDCKGTCAYEGKQIKRQLQRWGRTFPAQLGLECVLTELMGRSRWRRLRHHIGAADDADSASSPPRDWQPPADGTGSGPCLCAAAPATGTGPAATATATATAATAAASAASTDFSKQPESAFRRTDQVREDRTRPTRPRAAAADGSDGQVWQDSAHGQSWSMPASGCVVPPTLESLRSLESTVATPVAVHSASLGLQQLVSRHRSSPLQPSVLPDWSETLSYYQNLLASRVSAGVDQECADTPPDDEPLDLSCSRASPPPVASRPARRADPPPPTKKPYTEEELQAALRDIQSGRLGTRRAAVIYGIPRSTLRNKVYRLNALEKRAEQLAEAKRTPPPPPPPEAAATLTVKTEVEVPKVEAVVSEAVDMPPSQLLQARLMRPVEPVESVEPVRAAVMSWMYSGVLQRALQAREPAAARAEQPPVWDDFVRRMTHERFHEVLAQLRAAGAVAGGEETPSAPPPLPPLLPVSVTTAADMADESHGSDESELTSIAGSRKRKLEFTEDNNNTVPSPTPSAKSSKTTKAAAKGSRPKRGKYRNYNRSHLAEAVRAVQSGEMSVHRAGNFYGVPHSTLEYKVKQRHLDRAGRRERATERPPSASSPVPADRVATSGGVMTYRTADTPPPAGPMLPSEVLLQLHGGQRRPASAGDQAPGLLDKAASFARLLGGGLSISGITNRAHTAGGQVLQTTESS